MKNQLSVKSTLLKSGLLGSLLFCLSVVPAQAQTLEEFGAGMITLGALAVGIFAAIGVFNLARMLAAKTAAMFKARG